MARTNGFDGRRFSPLVSGLHSGNEGVFNLSKAARWVPKLFLLNMCSNACQPLPRWILRNWRDPVGAECLIAVPTPLTLVSERILHYPLGWKGPIPTSRTHGMHLSCIQKSRITNWNISPCLNDLFHLINHDYMPSLPYDAEPPPIGSSSSLVLESQMIRRPGV